MERLYVSNKNESVRMFKSDFMEFFSHVHPATPLILYLPVVGYMLYAALWRNALPLLVVAGLFLVGVLCWTLLEYVVHRYVFHYEPKSRLGKTLHFVVHGVHHDIDVAPGNYLGELLRTVVARDADKTGQAILFRFFESGHRAVGVVLLCVAATFLAVAARRPRPVSEERRRE